MSGKEKRSKSGGEKPARVPATTKIPLADELLSPLEVVDYLGGKICLGTLGNWRCKGKYGPRYIRLGGKIFYPLSVLIAWINGTLYSRTTDYRGSGGATA